ncbi:MAG TPA: helix-turn-helix transcriptional regulator, partial [Candidatus Kapabacteria bacterium]|nr:helix-turn-helix transcriptional regulator [Candidatus Kapabacteria bacterium]
EDLQCTLPTHDPVVAALHERYLQQQLQKLGHTSTRYRVFTEIVRRLKNGEPRRAEIAASIHVSERTLQRRLREENISFQELLNDARRELAQQYLADTRLTLAEVADLLGFGDQSNFFRASKRWFGVSPGQYRSRFESA